ncbi:MAG: hypothetical protein QXY50_04065 [Candidatus Caldarchaeum sp.]
MLRPWSGVLTYAAGLCVSVCGLKASTTAAAEAVLIISRLKGAERGLEGWDEGRREVVHGAEEHNGRCAVVVKRIEPATMSIMKPHAGVCDWIVPGMGNSGACRAPPNQAEKQSGDEGAPSPLNPLRTYPRHPHTSWKSPPRKKT